MVVKEVYRGLGEWFFEILYGENLDQLILQKLLLAGVSGQMQVVERILLWDYLVEFTDDLSFSAGVEFAERQ